MKTAFGIIEKTTESLNQAIDTFFPEEKYSRPFKRIVDTQSTLAKQTYSLFEDYYYILVGDMNKAVYTAANK